MVRCTSAVITLRFSLNLVVGSAFRQQLISPNLLFGKIRISAILNKEEGSIPHRKISRNYWAYPHL